jgi:octanoyl-[GcvH]:protein N-octanoyltransferase
LAQLRLITEERPGRPGFDTAISHALLRRVAAGELEATFRLRRAEPVLAFSKQDANSPGFERAVAAARERGFAPVLRLAGGRAAVFHEGTLAFAHSTPERKPTEGTRSRFEDAGEMLVAALGELGVDARVGEIPGEYCPGAFSVNARGQVKLAGLGQRMISGGAHMGAVVVATGGARIRDVLVAVYEALELDWDPATAGAVEDEVPGIGVGEVQAALITELAKRYELVEATLDADTLALAETLAERHAI